MAIVLNGTTGITAPDIDVTAQSTDIVTTGDVSAVDGTFSGGVYLGGTGAANYLDDYEEGTWTPTYTGGFTGVTYSQQSGYYTKIGSRVDFTLLINSTAATGTGDAIQITLPFAAQGGLTHTGGGSFAYVNSNLINSTSTNLPMVYISSGGTTLVLYKTNGNAFFGNDSSVATPQMYIVGSYTT